MLGWPLSLKFRWRNSLVVQWVKDPALSLQWLGLLLWCRFNPWPWELPHAAGAAKKTKKIQMDISHFPNYKEGGKNGIPEHGKSSFRLPSPGLKDGLHRTDIHHLTRSGCPRWWEEMRLHLSPKGEKKCDGIFYICHDSGRRKTVFTGAQAHAFVNG